MTTILLDGGPVAPDAQVSRTGGVPTAPAGTVWPVCRLCAGPLQFLGQIVLGDTAPAGPGVLALFMCAHRPGRCEQWSPTAGGNLALLLPAGDLVSVPAPAADGDVLGLGAVRAAVPVPARAGRHGTGRAGGPRLARWRTRLAPGRRDARLPRLRTADGLRCRPAGGAGAHHRHELRLGTGLRPRVHPLRAGRAALAVLTGPRA
ncbi:hypothetical protein ACGFNX_08680 [Streptomyces sp. NPDC048723]|uniref:hypothetical protein n=1 Tax=Streptomyces sp. NPDC048723 TaxID=3365589 RepID=UPI00371CEDF2